MKKLSDFSDANRAALHRVAEALMELVNEDGTSVYTGREVNVIVDAINEAEERARLEAAYAKMEGLDGS